MRAVNIIYRASIYTIHIYSDGQTLLCCGSKSGMVLDAIIEPQYEVSDETR